MECTKVDSSHAAEDLILERTKVDPSHAVEDSTESEVGFTRMEIGQSEDVLVSAVDRDEEGLQKANRDTRRKFGWRHLQIFMAFLGLGMMYVYRVNMSVAIVGMTDKEHRGATYNWSSTEKSNILSAFFWGYPWLQAALGNVADKYGSKYIFIAAILGAALTNLFTVFVAQLGVVPMVILRILHGFTQGAIYPCSAVVISKWIPPIERGPIMSFVFTGANVGTIVGFPLAGFLADTDTGWPLIFWVTSGLGLIWALVFLWIGASHPGSHRFISPEERRYIETSQRVDTAQSEEKLKTPWRAILLSLPVWALIIAHLGQNWGFWTLLNHLPNFIDKVLKFNIRKNGLLSALPYLVGWITAIVFSWIAFEVQQNTSISRTLHRKIWNSIAFWGDAAALIGLGVIDLSNATVVIIIFVSTLALNSGIFSGFITSHLDLTPNFAGTIMGLENSISSLTSALGPLVVGFIVTDETSPRQWQNVFILAGVIMFVTNLVYVIFGSAETQSWNEGEAEQ